MSGAPKTDDQVQVPTIMRALDPEVGDAIWAAIEPLLPERTDAHPLGCHRPRRNSQDLWMRNLANYAATSVSCSSDRSTITPFSNFTPARTRATSWGALTARHRVWADSISL